MIYLIENTKFIAAIFVGFFFGLEWYKNHLIKKKNTEHFRKLLLEVQQCLLALNNIFQKDNLYIPFSYLKNIIDSYTDLYETIQQVDLTKSYLKKEELNNFYRFKEEIDKCEARRINFNKEFTEKETKLYRAFFKNIEGKSLDDQQIRSIIVNDDNQLVTAGAGSGKTTSIVGKILYLNVRYNIRPEEFLVISFTNKSAESLQKRIPLKGVEAKTFHKFGLDVITECEGVKPSIYDSNQYDKFIYDTLYTLVKEKYYSEIITDYFLNYLKEEKGYEEFESHGEYIEYLNENNFRPYKTVESEFRENRTTYNREIVKSIEECRIANFLIFNGINYSYERPYPYKTSSKSHRQYKPDFTITEGDKTIYIEHFAIDREGNIPKFFVKDGDSYETTRRRYQSKIQWARDIHKENNTHLIETFSYQALEGSIEEKLILELTKAGVKIEPLTPQAKWEIINETANNEVQGLIKLIGTFINLMKSNSLSPERISCRNKRDQKFIELILPIHNLYQEELQRRDEIDFNDMIHLASNHINNKTYTKKFRHIIIDEFQDISKGRYELVNSLKTQQPECKLFCVGDDWQSIYRFSGSDLSLFRNFQQYFGHTVKSKIESTYRFNDPLMTHSSEFIQKNPLQEKKNLISKSSITSTSLEIIGRENGDSDDGPALKKILENLLSNQKDIEKKKILILGRYSFDVDRIDFSQIDIKRTKNKIHFLNLEASYLTIHQSKGLEADIVIIINCNEGVYGFPSVIEDDKVLSMVLSSPETFEQSEERRLFYVALTRAREKVYIIVNENYKSRFVKELHNKNSTEEIKNLCPNCKTGKIIFRGERISSKGYRYKHYGCSNYKSGCKYNDKIWVK